MYIYKTFQHDDEELMDEGLETIDPATIVARIRKIIISIRSSPQKTQSFESHVRLAKIVPSDLQVYSTLIHDGIPLLRCSRELSDSESL